MKAIVIDAVASARKNLISNLNNLNLGIHVLGETGDLEEAKQFIEVLHPELVFIDISMPHGKGFDLLSNFSEVQFNVIFTSSYNQYVLKFFQYFDIDYIIKPIESDKLRLMVLKAIRTLERKQYRQNNNRVSSYFKSYDQSSIIAIPIESGLEFIHTEDILKLSTSEGYTIIYLKDSTKIVSSKPLSYYWNILDSHHFFQVHRAFVVNLNCIKKYHKVGFIQLADGSEIPLAKTKKTDFLNLFKK